MKIPLSISPRGFFYCVVELSTFYFLLITYYLFIDFLSGFVALLLNHDARLRTIKFATLQVIELNRCGLTKLNAVDASNSLIVVREFYN